MRIAAVGHLSLAALCTLCISISPVVAESYMVWEEYGGSWHDVEKSPLTGDDDNLCWAATASSVLAWGGWSTEQGMSADMAFQYYQSHWSNAGGLMSFAWRWWFEGVNPAEGQPGWAQVDILGGGFAEEDFLFSEYYRRTTDDAEAMEAVEAYLHDGMGVGLVLAQEGGAGHTVACWGIETSDSGYSGIWFTDSDDDQEMDEPADSLRWAGVSFQAGRWVLGHDGGGERYITEVQALAPRPRVETIPEPATMMLVMMGALAGAAMTVARTRPSMRGRGPVG